MTPRGAVKSDEGASVVPMGTRTVIGFGEVAGPVADGLGEGAARGYRAGERGQSAASISTSCGGFDVVRAKCWLWMRHISGVGRMVVMRVVWSAKTRSHCPVPWWPQETRGDPALFRYLRGGDVGGAGLRHLVAKLVMSGDEKAATSPMGSCCDTRRIQLSVAVLDEARDSGSTPSAMFMARPVEDRSL